MPPIVKITGPVPICVFAIGHKRLPNDWSGSGPSSSRWVESNNAEHVTVCTRLAVSVYWAIIPRPNCMSAVKPRELVSEAAT
jgi:hypothetical protein